MSKNDILSFKMEDIIVFIAVADSQSVTKAAEHLYYSPSQVSKIIRKLEAIWGLDLFQREKGAMRLTEAGKHLYQILNENPRFYEKVIGEAFAIHNDEQFVRIACPTLPYPSDFFAPALREYSKIHPNISVSVECNDAPMALRKMLVQGSVDIIYTSELEILPLPEAFQWQPIRAMSLSIVLNKTHPLAQKEDLCLEDLANEDFVIVYPEINSRESYVIKLCKDHGFTPRVAKFVPNIHSLLLEIGVNSHLVAVDSVQGLSVDGQLKYWEVSDVVGYMGLACRQNASPFVEDFFKFISEYYVTNGNSML